MDFSNYKVGQWLIVELENETLIGELRLISYDNRVIELKNVRDFHTGYVFECVQCLPKPLVKSIKICKPDGEEQPTASDETEEEIIKIEHVKPKDDTILVSIEEFERIQSILARSTYIFQTDRKYHKALGDIKSQSIIAVHLEPVEFGRHNRPSLLAVGTPQEIYIFDLLLLGKMFKEIKTIMQAERPKKIVYYSNKTADHLQYQHNVMLAGVFDIFVANCLITKEKSPLSLGQCVTKYFNIPPNYFEGEEELKKDIHKRPLQQTHLDLVAKKIVFLHKLYEHMLHDIMLKNFYKQCNEFSVAHAANKDNAEVAIQMAPQRVHGIEYIGDDAWMDFLQMKL